MKHKGISFKSDCDGGGGSGLSSTEAVVLKLTVCGCGVVGGSGLSSTEAIVLKLTVCVCGGW